MNVTLDEAARERYDTGDVVAAVNGVIDPCSVFNGTRLGLVDLGMVDEVAVRDGAAKVTLRLDDPVCVYTFVIHQGLREALATLGVHEVEFEINGRDPWTEDRLSETARRRLTRHASPR
jgi:metal-sulfur cluster biosynthetic enzyme